MHRDGDEDGDTCGHADLPSLNACALVGVVDGPSEDGVAWKAALAAELSAGVLESKEPLDRSRQLRQSVAVLDKVRVRVWVPGLEQLGNVAD
eukprot:7116153-Prymnesium_polylepis.1